MSVTRRRTVKDIARQKGKTPIVCLTSYTAPMARLTDEYADIILVGDSVGMVLYGFDSTLPVTLELMINHGAAVVRATNKALVVVDMPFGSYQESPEQAYRNAVSIMQRTGCAAVKLEGGAEMAETVSFLTRRGVAVMGHIGLQPQSVNASGGYGIRGRDADDRIKIMSDAVAISDAGAFALVIECTEESLAGEITARVSIPTIGIGASAACDGQVLVTEDMLGFTGAYIPKFVKQYADLHGAARQGIENFASDVRARLFPEHPEKLPENLQKSVSSSKKDVA